MTICEFCGKEFEPKNNHKNYTQKCCCKSCSRKAAAQKNRAERVARICKYCGKEFIPKDAWRKNNYRFCSKHCASKHAWENGDRKEMQRQGKNRPLTPDTVHIVKMWHEKGDSPELIAYVLNRDIETINGILSGEIT